MSDSDDTDILLLMPPDYFLTTSEEKLRYKKIDQECKRDASEIINAAVGHLLDDSFETENRHHHKGPHISLTMDAVGSMGSNLPPPTASYKFLAPNRKAELNHINSRIHTIEQEEGCHFHVPSDISSVSTSTARTQFSHKPIRNTFGPAHSTPNANSSNQKRSSDNAVQETGVLVEIDNFLEDNHLNSYWMDGHCSDDFALQKQSGDVAMGRREPQTTSLPNTLNCLPQGRIGGQQLQAQPPPPDSNLISLSEIWGKSGQGTAICSTHQSALKEEQLRRQHLEKTVRSLQSRLLEYQQRLSVAVEVDRAKDAALSNAQLESKNLNLEGNQLRESLHKLDLEKKEYSSRMDALQIELNNAVGLASKLEERNQILEAELAAYSRETNECTAMYKQQLEDLEFRMHGCKRSEELALIELSKLKDRLAKSEHQNEKIKARCDYFEQNQSALKHQKDLLQEYHQKQKCRADTLESEKKALQDALAHLKDIEATYKHKLETQQKSLKTHYQQQLESVVAKKLREFQEQVDKSEENLRAEARDRERLIAERTVKQLQLINEKSELEMNLLQEKHNEEVELYRIQLANASKKIDTLELKLNCYKSKRADIAEKLHDVMEVQWQKALEILTSPSQMSQVLTDTDADPEAETESPESNNTDTPSNQEHGHYFETPKTSKCRKESSKENNLNVNNKGQHMLAPERLQAYIELLLSKSPADFDKLDEILALTVKARATDGKSDKPTKRNKQSKPPWKA